MCFEAKQTADKKRCITANKRKRADEGLKTFVGIDIGSFESPPTSIRKTLVAIARPHATNGDAENRIQSKFFKIIL